MIMPQAVPGYALRFPAAVTLTLRLQARIGAEIMQQAISTQRQQIARIGVDSVTEHRRLQAHLL